MAIRVLPPELVSKIAAGEVVERPASVVKELIENGLDAGARSLRIEIRHGGRDLIRVTDDGIGMAPEDVRLAVEPHATSKVTSLADLQNITTLGFRGEALASIAAVSRFTITSRPEGSDAGYEVQIDGGRPVTERARGCPTGTAVTVRDLFQHVPARLKFLRSVATETSYITRGIQAYALGRPDVRFELVVDGRATLRTMGDGDLRAAAGQVFGTGVAAAMLDVDGAAEAVDAPVSLTGLTSHPVHDRADRSQIVVFVNGRWIEHRGMTFALEEAYHSLLMVGRHPSAVLHVSVPPHLVDVNVHPTKKEVRFVHEREVTRIVGASVRSAVLGNTQPAAVPLVSLPSAFVQRELGERGSAARSSGFAVRGAGVGPSGMDDAASAATYFENPARSGSLDPRTAHPEPSRSVPNTTATTAFPSAAKLRVIGQVANTYIIAEDATGMYLIDQHAAHERVMLERMRVMLGRNEPETQWLLAPITCAFPAAVHETLETARDDLARLGFVIEGFGEGTWLLRGVPATLRGQHEQDPVKTLEATLAELHAGGAGGEGIERLAALLACHNAIRAGQTLTDPEMRALIRQLEAVESPGHCAHGRPTMLHISQRDLEREFARR
jgi:DNA mismatch repair protein MutL